MSLGPGLRTPEARPGRQIAALLGLALLSALVSNALAGPARRLAWRPAPPPQAPVRPAGSPVPAPAPAPAPATTQVTTPTPTTAAPTPTPAAPAAPARTPAPRPPAAPSLREAFPPPADGAPLEISEEEAFALFQAGAVFLDARRMGIHAMGHIKGARVISPWEDGLEAKVQAFADATFDPKDPVVLYCSGGDCRDSHLLAERLWPLGFRNLRIFKGGWPAWQARGWPTAQGMDAPW